MTYKIVRAVTALFGLCIFATSIDSSIQSYTSPVSKESLKFIAGKLTDVTKCTYGRRAHFFYTITSPTSQTTFKDWCPNEKYDTLRKSKGATVQINFHAERGFMFSAENYVYELTVAGHVLSTYECRAKHLNSVSWLVTLLSLAAACCGLAMIYLSLRLSSWPTPSLGTSASCQAKSP